MQNNNLLYFRPADGMREELTELLEEYNRVEMTNLKLAGFIKTLVARGAKQIRERIDATAYAVTDPH
jgi:hypothetical protein